MAASWQRRGGVLHELDLHVFGERSSRCVAVCGPPGSGKSQLAAWVCHQHRSAFDLVLWLNAESEEALQSSLLAVAAALGVAVNRDEKQGLEGQQLAEAVGEWVEQHASGRLLVLDNVPASGSSDRYQRLFAAAAAAWV